MYVVCLQSEQQLYLDCWFDRLLGKSVALLPCIHLHWFDSPLGKSAALSPYSHLQEKRKKRALLTTMQKKRWRLVLYSRLGRADLAFMLMQKHLAPPQHTHTQGDTQVPYTTNNTFPASDAKQQVQCGERFSAIGKATALTTRSFQTWRC